MRRLHSMAIGVSAAFALVLVQMSREVHADFLYADFSSTAGLNLVGNAAQAGNKLRITPATGSQVGGAWYTTKQPIEGGFQTTFSFQISDPGGDGGGADGFAFVLQNDSLSALGPDGTPGYGSKPTENTGILNSLAIEFDTFTNTDLGDPNGNHVSVQTRGTARNDINHAYSLGCATPGFALKDGGIHTATIRYVPNSMAVYLDDLQTALLTVNVDLASTLNLDQGRAWVGFTAGTKAGWENHDIHNWSFTQAPEPSALVLLGAGAAGLVGCGLRRCSRGLGRKGTGTFFGLGARARRDNQTGRKMSQSPAA